MAKIPNAVLRLAWTGQLKEKHCSHLDKIQHFEPDLEGCEACISLGDDGVHLRMCLVCGHVGCCSSSRNDHAGPHYKDTGHALTKPYKQPIMDWVWCYKCKALLDPQPKD